MKKVAKLTPVTPESNKKSFVLGVETAVEPASSHSNEASKLDHKLSESDKSIQTNLEASREGDLHTTGERSSAAEVDQRQSIIPDNLALELLEKVRISTNLNNLNYNVCKLTLKSIVDCLKLRIPGWHDECNTILRQIDSCDQTISKEFIQTSTDYLELKSLFNKLWFCKNDEQQRSWPIQEDEEQIKYILNSLANILTNANPKISKEVLCDHNCENISLLITYFQVSSFSLDLYPV